MSRIAVVGAGISGMAAAYLLSQKHEVSLFERELRLGGHTHTHDIETSRGVLKIDTGFIVHNDRTYPNLVRLFRKLGVQRQPSDMSFGVSCRETAFEYSTRGVAGFFGSNLLRLRQFRLFAEILRFNRKARFLLRSPANVETTLGEFISAQGFGGDFARYYLKPMAAAVWSTSLEEIEEFPAFTLFRFLDNHGLLGITTQAQWYVLKGGSSVYIAPLTAPYKRNIHLGARIEGVRRMPAGVQIVFEDRPSEHFDEVVFACHAPQALQLLKDATPSERSVLLNFRTSRNRTVLHTDSRLLPQRPSARASWNYHLGVSSGAATLTYHISAAGPVDSRGLLRDSEQHRFTG
ncbi:MAG: FAD-dependent oxidoreductase [Terracidiphilus sp.]